MIEKEVIEAITKGIERAMDVMIKQTRIEISDQGHILTGNLLRSIERETIQQASVIVCNMLLNDYFRRINDGIPASEISYSQADIQRLFIYFELRGHDMKEAKRIAYATINRHHIEGLPTRGSYAYSNNNRRTKFIEQSFSDSFNKMITELEFIPDYIQRAVDNLSLSFKNLKAS